MTYPTEIRAQALALAVQGYTPFRIAKELGLGDQRTVSRWIADSEEFQEISAKYKAEMIDNSVQIALEADALILRNLGYLAEQPDSEVVKHGLMLNAFSGTAKDKVLADRKAPAQTIQVGQAVIIIKRAE